MHFRVGRRAGSVESLCHCFFSKYKAHDDRYTAVSSLYFFYLLCVRYLKPGKCVCMCMCVCVRVRVQERACVCVCVCVRACSCACVLTSNPLSIPTLLTGPTDPLPICQSLCLFSPSIFLSLYLSCTSPTPNQHPHDYELAPSIWNFPLSFSPSAYPPVPKTPIFTPRQTLTLLAYTGSKGDTGFHGAVPTND